ncbi:MAG: hypothetical protein K5685_04260 [Bacteroidales bacterium]|nr:hypothetical protein [Bacteroidales bacterium]
MDKKSGAIIILSVLLLCTAAGGYFMLKSEKDKNAALEKQITTLSEKEKRNAVDREVSRQLEEIAYEQEQISDERRKEAERQSFIAKSMTKRAEEERIRAVNAQQEALEAEKNALNARDNAEIQRKIAEEKQREAEYSKSVVDTLSFKGLGHSLAALSVTQYLAGEKETAVLLAAASCYFTETYKGDFYDQSVFQALLLSSGGTRVIRPGFGIITAAEFLPDGDLLSVSGYGEIFKCTKDDSKVIFFDKAFSFRDLKIADDGTGYALSFTGDLFVIKNEKYEVINLEGVDRSFCMSRLDNGNLVIAGENKLAVFDTDKKQVIKILDTDGKISCVSRKKVFLENGSMYTISENFVLEKFDNPQIKGIVSAYTESPHGTFVAYGTRDGMIYFEGRGYWVELAGHVSEITDLHFVGNGLLSSSMDKSVKHWIASDGKGIPITVRESQNWVMCLAVKPGGTKIVMGDADGVLTVCPISPGEMKEALKNSVKRDFTQSEWNLYIGKNIPYTTFSDKL